MTYEEIDWSESLKWLQEHPGAEPGGDPDLFDMPLPKDFPVVGGLEWTGSPEWGEQNEGVIGTTWNIENSGYQVVVTDRESYIRNPEGFRVQEGGGLDGRLLPIEPREGYYVRPEDVAP